jgi:hypothetical protein
MGGSVAVRDAPGRGQDDRALREGSQQNEEGGIVKYLHQDKLLSFRRGETRNRKRLSRHAEDMLYQKRDHRVIRAQSSDGWEECNLGFLFENSRLAISGLVVERDVAYFQ